METKEQVITFSSWADVNDARPFQVIDRDVNGWLEGHPQVTIVQRLASVATAGRGVLTSVTIFYREPEPEAEAPDPSSAPTDTVTIPLPDLSMARATQQLEEQLIHRALKAAGGHRQTAAKLLEIPLSLLEHQMEVFEIG